MAEAQQQLECRGLRVQLRWPVPVGALRYFSPAGDFAGRLRAAGLALPETGQAREERGRGLILAWRSPTETVCLATSEQVLTELGQPLAAAADGCLVDLTGAFAVLHLAGERIAELCDRLGGSAWLPQPGEARRCRMADLPVLALCVQQGEVSLLIERGFAEHLLGWIRESLLDFP
jgi:hypothetical protein